MKTMNAFLFAGAFLAAPVLAFAQAGTSAGDARYCADLSHQYQKYVANQEDKHPQSTPADVSTAMDQCKSNTASAIPVLEKALKDAKVDLPPRT